MGETSFPSRVFRELANRTKDKKTGLKREQGPTMNWGREPYVRDSNSARQRSGTCSNADWYVLSRGNGTYCSGSRNNGISGNESATPNGSMKTRAS